MGRPGLSHLGVGVLQCLSEAGRAGRATDGQRLVGVSEGELGVPDGGERLGGAHRRVPRRATAWRMKGSTRTPNSTLAPATDSACRNDPFGEILRHMSGSAVGVVTGRPEA